MRACLFLPNEDEWYKAAYYKGGGTNAGYWDYPTQADVPPTAEVPPGLDMANGSANYWHDGFVDLTYYTTEVGAYTAKPSDSAYGTLDQGGNVLEWNETLLSSLGEAHGVRGGSFAGHGDDLQAAYRDDGIGAEYEGNHIGFRLAEVLRAASADQDGDGDVDLCDFALFQRQFSGPR